MPKVRASSGTIGTTRSPSDLSFNRVDRMRTKAIVVLIWRLPEVFNCPANALRGGAGSAYEVFRRAGMWPPNSARRSRM